MPRRPLAGRSFRTAWSCCCSCSSGRRAGGRGFLPAALALCTVDTLCFLARCALEGPSLWNLADAAYRALLLILLLRGVCAMPELAARERSWREAERALALAAMGGENFPRGRR